METELKQPKSTPLTQEKREEAADIANGQADITPDGGHRNPDWDSLLN